MSLVSLFDQRGMLCSVLISVCLFSVDIVEKAVHDLNISKTLDCERLCIAHVLYAHPAIFACLNVLYNTMILHGYVPERMGLSIVIPTLKNVKKSTNDITNYRPISIMPIVGKIFEKCMAGIIEPQFTFHDNQFGFVNNGGCGKALFAFKNIVNYFGDRGSKVYCCSLDLSKAFDRIDHYALLKVMYEKGMPFHIISLFANWWGKLCDKVLWGGKLSQSFTVGSGVLQGSLLGGKFFNLMMDCVLCKLQE